MLRNTYKDVSNVSKTKFSIRRSQENYTHWKFHKDHGRRLASTLLDLCLGLMCCDSMLKVLSKELTLVLSDTRELDRVPSTE